MLRSRLLNYCSTAFHGTVRIGRTTWTLNTFFLLLGDWIDIVARSLTYHIPESLYLGYLNHLEQLSWFQLLS